jgi:glycosyltransferase 2 family protein
MTFRTLEAPVEPTGSPDPVQPSPEREAIPQSRNVVRSVLVFVLVGVILYAVASLATSNYRMVFRELARFPAGSLAAVVGLVIFGWLLRGWRFFYYLEQSELRVPLGYAISTFLASFALTGTPGKMGEAVKGVFLKEDYGIPVTRVVGILVVERLMDLLGVLALGSCSVLLFEGWTAMFVLCAGVVLAGGCFLCMERLYRPVLEWTARFHFLEWVSRKVLETLLAGKELMTPRIVVTGLVVSTFAWAMESLALYVILRSYHLPVSLLEANFVYSFSTIVGALSMLPGGIGGTEAGMVGLLAFLGISYDQGLPSIILIRVCTLWLAIVVGVVFMLYRVGVTGKRPAPPDSA